MLRDERDLHLEFFARQPRLLDVYSAFSLITSRLNCAVSSCFTFTCRWTRMLLIGFEALHYLRSTASGHPGRAQPLHIRRRAS